MMKKLIVLLGTFFIFSSAFSQRIHEKITITDQSPVSSDEGFFIVLTDSTSASEEIHKATKGDAKTKYVKIMSLNNRLASSLTSWLERNSYEYENVNVIVSGFMIKTSLVAMSEYLAAVESEDSGENKVLLENEARIIFGDIEF